MSSCGSRGGLERAARPAPLSRPSTELQLRRKSACRPLGPPSPFFGPPLLRPSDRPRLQGVRARGRRTRRGCSIALDDNPLVPRPGSGGAYQERGVPQRYVVVNLPGATLFIEGLPHDRAANVTGRAGYVSVGRIKNRVGNAVPL